MRYFYNVGSVEDDESIYGQTNLGGRLSCLVFKTLQQLLLLFGSSVFLLKLNQGRIDHVRYNVHEMCILFLFLLFGSVFSRGSLEPTAFDHHPL